MGKKKKAKKRGSKNTERSAAKMTVQQLIVKGGQFLGQGKTRDAFVHLKQAEKKAGRDEKTDILLFEACVLCRRELMEKGLVSEAKAMQKQAREYFPGVQRVDESLMASYMGCLSGEAPFSAYGRYFEKRGPSPKIERILADSLIMERRWDFLDRLSEDSLLKRDGEPARRAVEMVVKGGWENACDELKTISRTSPFAAFRLFCRAMAAFYKEDDQAARRAIAMIPQDFRLHPFLEKLDLTLSQERDESEKRNAMMNLDCLWDGPLMAEKRARSLIGELSRKPPQACSKAITAFAESVFPENPEMAVEETLHIIWKHLIDDSYNRLGNLKKTAAKVLGKERTELLLVKFSYLFAGRTLRQAGEYIKILSAEFSKKDEQKVAHSFILRQTIASGLDRIDDLFYPGFFVESGIGPLSNLLGIESKDWELAPIEMLNKSIALDPENREGYELLAKVPCSSREAKNKMEQAFICMMKRFPDDPFPCLELADLYYSKNAFRKAENVLDEAMKRAPHDNRVLDRHALAFVVSAEKNFKRGNYHLSWPDLEKARDLNRPKLSVIVAAKRILHRILAEKEDIQKALESETANFSQAEKLRTMAATLSELKESERDSGTRVFEKFQKLFRKEVKTVSRMPSAERIALIAPLEKHQRQVCETRMARVFMEYDTKLLKGVADKELPFAIDVILEADLIHPVLAEMDRRIKKGGKNDCLVLEFYRAVIGHDLSVLKGGGVFRDIVARASESERKKLEEAARRLAPRTKGNLKVALGQFNFDLLDALYSRPPLDDYDFEDFDFEEDDFEDVFLDEEDFIFSTIDRIEDSIDELGLRRAPDSVLKATRKDMLNSPIGGDHKRMADIIRPYAYELSHKAQILLYGKKISRV